MKKYICFDEYGNEINEWIELPDESEYYTQHFTREIISQYFEKEKVLRTLSGEKEDKYRKEYQKEIRSYIPVYDDLSPFEENGKWGLKNNLLGIVTLAPEYDEVTDFYNDHLCGYSCCKVRVGDKYGLVEPNKKGGKIICPPVYDNLMTLEAYLGADSQLVAIVTELNGKYGLSFGKHIDLEAIYDKFIIPDNCSDHLLTVKDGKYGLDKQIPAEFDEIQIPSLMGFVRARKGDTWGYFDVDRQFTEDISKAFLHHFGWFWYYEENEKAYLNSLFDDYSKWIESVFRRTMPKSKRQYLGAVNEDEPPFERKVLFWQLNEANLTQKMGLQLYVAGVDLIPPRYDELMDMNGHMFCYRQNGKYGLVLADGKGTELCPPLYDEIVKMKYLEGDVLVRIGQKWGVVNCFQPRFPTELEYDELIERERNWSCEYLIKKGDKLGVFIDGHIVPPVYDGVFVPEVFGWVRVLHNGEWGYLDVRNEFTADVNDAYLCFPWI